MPKNHIPSRRILLTNSFLDYYKVHQPESFNYFLNRYQHQTLEGLGVEFFNVSIDDENFIEEIQKEFLK